LPGRNLTDVGSGNAGEGQVERHVEAGDDDDGNAEVDAGACTLNLLISVASITA